MHRQLVVALLWPPLSFVASVQGLPPGFCTKPQFAPVEAALEKPPRIQSRPVVIPKLRLTFSSEESDSTPAESRVTVCYDWEWYRFPYSERFLGGWDISSECRQCRLDSEGKVTVASHRVIPRGWYDGFWRWGRKPRFVGVRFGLESGAGLIAFSYLEAQEIERLRKGESAAEEFEREPIRLLVAVP